MRGRPKDVNKAERILKAAGCQFISHGLNHTTMDSIAKEAGVSKYTVYNHFGSKEALFQSVIEGKCKTFMDNASFDDLSDLPAEKGLMLIAKGFVEILFDDEAIAMHRTIMAESRHDDVLPKLFFSAGPKYVSDILGNYLSQLKKRGELHIDHIERAVEVFLSLFSGRTHMKVVLRISETPSKKSLQSFVKENVRIFLKVYAPERP